MSRSLLIDLTFSVSPGAAPSPCLLASPSDVVTSIGQIVYLTAASNTTHLRWYRNQSTGRENLIYNGRKVNRAVYDPRYDVLTGSWSQNGSDLLIRDIRLSDSGPYVARDEKLRIEVVANIIVLGECPKDRYLKSADIHI